MRELIHDGQMRGHRAVVLGAGASGTAAVRLLRALGATVRWVDRNDPGAQARELAAALGVEVLTGEHSPQQFEGADLVVVSPGVPVRKLAHALSVVPQGKLVSELELASWFCHEPVVAVTGTNGKTTTVSLIGHMLRNAGKDVFVGGNIGTPLSEYLLSGQRADVLVLEVSSFQLQNCRSFRPRVGVLLNFSANHLDYHECLEEYLAAKLQIFARQTQDDLAILPLELKAELEAREFTKARRVYFVATRRFPETKLLGEHNRANLEAAWLACKAMGVDEPTAAAAVASFAPLPHRIEPVAEAGGVLFVDDSKATTVEAMAAAIRAVERPVRLLAGGVWKGGDLSALEPFLVSPARPEAAGEGGTVRAVALFGKSREIFEAAWADKVAMTWDPTLEEAVRRLFAQAKPGEAILLSPATASFDLYTDYKARGDDFARVARLLAKGGAA